VSDLLSLGLGGLQAYRAALAAVGENVANAETPGFTRRTVRLQPATTAGAQSDPLYRDQLAFQGVTAAAVVRAWDMFKAAEARHAASAAGRADVRAGWLGSVEAALDDGPAGIGARLTGFFNAADALAASPSDTLGRRQLLMALEDVASSFRTTAATLERTAGGIAAAAATDVAQLNSELATLQKVNATLRIARDGGTAAAALQDERDRLIDSIAQKIGVVAAVEPDGTTRLSLAEAPGSLLVGPGDTAAFAVSAGADGRLTLTLANGAGTSTLAPTTGRLAGLIEVAGTLAGRRAALDQLAADFAAALNAWSAAGRDPSGSAGLPLLDVPSGAASMRALVSDPARVPAASAAGVANGNLLALAALRGASGAERSWADLVSANAQSRAAAIAEQQAAATWRDNAAAALDEVTGVDLDREAADLLRYQQAYSASARIVQVGRDLVDTILKL
jgi:flagellar hook-associated protein 1